MCLLPCFGATALASYKVKKTVDKAFSSKKPEPPTEPAFVTEAKLRWNLTGWKPATAAAPPTQPEGQRSKRSDRWAGSQQSSKQRLAELVDQHKNKQQKAPSQQQAPRR